MLSGGGGYLRGSYYLIKTGVIARQYIDFFTIPFGGGADGLPYAHLLTALDSFRRGITIAQRHSADSQQNKSKNFHSDINVKT